MEGNVLGLFCAVVSPNFDDSRPSQRIVRVPLKQPYTRAKLLELMVQRLRQHRLGWYKAITVVDREEDLIVSNDLAAYKEIYHLTSKLILYSGGIHHSPHQRRKSWKTVYTFRLQYTLTWGTVDPPDIHHEQAGEPQAGNAKEEE